MVRKATLICELKIRRQCLGWSLAELAGRCGIDGKFLGEWERGDGSPRLEAIEAWAAALGLKLALAPAEVEAGAGLSVDWHHRLIAVDGTPVRLTPMEWKALERLARTPGELVSHQALFCHLYGEGESYSSRSTAIRVLVTKLRRLLPLQIEARWGRGYVLTGIDAASHPAPAPAPAPINGAAAPRPGGGAVPTGAAPGGIAPLAVPRKPLALHRALAETGGAARRGVAVVHNRPNQCRAEELGIIDRFLAERGATRCPDVATIQHAPLPTLVWDKIKRKWVRPATHEATGREAG
jgi:transcriptional regulator with XRE-family HTH domain